MKQKLFHTIKGQSGEHVDTLSCGTSSDFVHSESHLANNTENQASAETSLSERQVDARENTQTTKVFELEQRKL